MLRCLVLRLSAKGRLATVDDRRSAYETQPEAGATGGCGSGVAWRSGFCSAHRRGHNCTGRGREHTVLEPGAVDAGAFAAGEPDTVAELHVGTPQRHRRWRAGAERDADPQALADTDSDRDRESRAVRDTEADPDRGRWRYGEHHDGAVSG
jgi:hypothetical protein